MNDFKVAFFFFLIHSIRSRSSVQAIQHFDLLSELTSADYWELSTHTCCGHNSNKTNKYLNTMVISLRLWWHAITHTPADLCKDDFSKYALQSRQLKSNGSSAFICSSEAEGDSESERGYSRIVWVLVMTSGSYVWEIWWLENQSLSNTLRNFC